MTTTDSRQFRNCLGKYATGVTVVTAADQRGNPHGMTVNSFASVSLDPPLILWCLGKDSGCYEIFRAARYFAVHVLHNGQQAISERFAGNRDERFAGFSYHTGVENTPLLDDYYARFECQIEQRHEGGDHLILVGRVLHFEERDAEPLVFHGGRYKILP